MKEALKDLYFNKKIDKNQAYYIDCLKKNGVSIGENVVFMQPSKNVIDMVYPFMIEIGNNVCFSSGITILTHDYSHVLSRRLSGMVLSGVGKVKIGNNIQIGINTTILMGTEIESDVIIAANSLLKGKYESGYVYGGSPAKKICSINDFFQRREKIQTQMAVELTLEYKKKYGVFPNKKLFEPSHLFVIFSPINEYPDHFWKGHGQLNNSELIKKYYSSHARPFASFEDFIRHCEEASFNDIK